MAGSIAGPISSGPMSRVEPTLAPRRSTGAPSSEADPDSWSASIILTPAPGDLDRWTPPAHDSAWGLLKAIADALIPVRSLTQCELNRRALAQVIDEGISCVS